MDSKLIDDYEFDDNYDIDKWIEMAKVKITEENIAKQKQAIKMFYEIQAEKIRKEKNNK